MLNPIFVIDLTGGGMIEASSHLNHIFKQFCNVENLEIIVVFTKFKHFKKNIFDSLSENEEDFDEMNKDK